MRYRTFILLLLMATPAAAARFEEAFVDRTMRVDIFHTGGAADTPMRLPAAYWRSIDSVDAIAEAQAIRQPLLLLQGGRDIQVVDADWQRWQAAFGNDSRATLRHYPALNHLGIAGEGPGTLAEYLTAGHVDAQLIADVAAWIRALSGRP